MKSKPPTYSCLGMGCSEDTAALLDLVCPNGPPQVARQLTWEGTGGTALLRDRGGTAALAVLEVTRVMLLTAGHKRIEVNGLGWKEEQNILVFNFLLARATTQASSRGEQFPAWKRGQTS